MVRKFIRQFLTISTDVLSLLAIGVTIMLALSGCHATKPGRAASSQRLTKAEIEQMKRHVDSRKYDIREISDLVGEAKTWIGVPYLYGGHAHSGTDCSGMVMEVYKAVMREPFPRDSRSQSSACIPVGSTDIMPGDLLFFATGSDTSRISHVGLYIGSGEMIHASSSKGVVVSRLDERYYTSHYHSAGRPTKVARLYDKSKKKKTRKNELTLPSEEETPPIDDYMEPDLDALIENTLDSIFREY